jgi:short-subunit dehydrogenase
MLLIVLLVLIRLTFYLYDFIWKYFIISEIDIIDRYGKDTWVLITGCSSGQGKRFAIEFAKRGFNIILSGNEKIKKVESYIKSKYSVKTITIVTDFSNAYKPDYFEQFEKCIDSLPNKLSILVNNVGHRVAWEPYHEMPEKLIHQTISVGTFVQSRLTQIALKHFMKNDKKTAIINITAQCTIPSLWPSNNGYITVPYLSVYESSNAFGFFHSNSIQEEYGDRVDILNITPGAVITENTHFLRGTPFSIECKPFVKHIFKLLGNYTGPTCAYWGHEVGGLIANISETYKKYILKGVGKIIVKTFKDKIISEI